LVAATTVSAFGACGEGSAGGSDPDETPTAIGATIEDFDFQPDPIRVRTGETVKWTNRDDILHTVTSGRGQKQGIPGVSEDKPAKPDGLFDQEMDGVGATFSFTFDEAGAFTYYCAIHPGMRGEVIVTN